MSRLYSIFFLMLLVLSCKKESTKPDPTTPAPTKGKAIFFLKQDCAIGNVEVTINGETRLIKDFSSSKPSCDMDSSYAIFSLEKGEYSFTASGGNSLVWNGKVTVTTNDCTGMQLTCTGVTTRFIGMPGYPRFNLKHSVGVDFDLNVITPDSLLINSFNTNRGGSAGSMDLISGCLGSDTDYGFSGMTLTNENFWCPQGHATHGTYTFWVKYADYCGASAGSGTYTLSVLDGLSTVKTYSGTLTPNTIKSAIYTLVY